MRNKLIRFISPLFKELNSHLLVISLSAAILWHFSNIWIYGQFLIGEPNIVIRSLETALLLFIFVLGVCRFIGDLKGGKSRQKVRPDMITFKLGKGKSIEERKAALISQIKQINGELYNIRRL